VEYGLQSIHKKTLEFIGRGHSSEDFLQAIDLTQNKGIKICAHIILGLPEETRKEIMETVKLVSNLNIQGIKIHLLHVLKDTPLEKIYLKGDIKLLSMDEYISLVCDILELLPKDMIIQRVTGEGDKDIHIAPLWALEKAKVLQGIDRELVKRDSHQGKKYS
jgi:radical SAM protein (TIGR01212 family)